MTHREDRRFLKREVLTARHLQALAGKHALMGPLMTQRLEGLEARLAALPPGGREPRTILFFSGRPVRGSEGIDAQFACAVLQPFLEMVNPNTRPKSTARLESAAHARMRTKRGFC